VYVARGPSLAPENEAACVITVKLKDVKTLARTCNVPLWVKPLVKSEEKLNEPVPLATGWSPGNAFPSGARNDKLPVNVSAFAAKEESSSAAATGTAENDRRNSPRVTDVAYRTILSFTIARDSW
jgi:hypothetical protein